MTNSNDTSKAFQYAISLCDKWRHEFVTPEHVLYAIAEQEPFVEAASTAELDIPHIISAMMELKESLAAYCLHLAVGDDQPGFMSFLVSCYEMSRMSFMDMSEDGDEEGDHMQPKQWRSLVTCLNDTYASHNPLIGREDELERTIRVLCRKDKNNPLHVGEPGVGKTALVYGLTAMIERGEVPERLKGARVYMMDMATMVAGAQFRGDFEKRMKMVMEGLAAEGNAILYIDEIHNLVGAGRSGGDSSLDGANILKPYLENGVIRFIGSTTYDEFNRYVARQKSLVRRFQQIDIAEPSIDDAIRIVSGLLPGYEKFHGVKYAKGAAEYAVRYTSRYMKDRFLPDKAVDLLDEAGAYRETHPLTTQKRQSVDRKLLSDVLAKLCKIDADVLKEGRDDRLMTLADDMKRQIYGQDTAVDKVVEAVQMAKAGLAEDQKPMASLLFVGPTGVGKTEVARVLANQLGVRLVRFDMSEYAEKHAVAKLIGSPAGYVGYEDGGLLTDAIRKTPNCVLLFDEIEKAHPDIYNIFLQVMDYASLTDNRGQRADFQEVIIIMTSNAGAQYASRANIGFGGTVSRGEAMLTQVKKTFKPEFLNRLTDTIVFHDMDRHMAELILDKSLRRLADKLAAKKVELTVSDEARELLLKKGFTAEYGARELDRVVSNMLKPLLMREILFGWLRGGGKAATVVTEGKIELRKVEK